MTTQNKPQAASQKKEVDQIEKVKHEAEKRIGEATKKAKKEMAKAKKEVDQCVVKAKKYAKENPEKTILISAGVGVAVGLLLSMVMRRRD